MIRVSKIKSILRPLTICVGGCLFFYYYTAYPLSSGQTTGEYIIKAAFIEKFTRFITWPAGTKINTPDSLVEINIIGTHPFNDLLRSVYRTQRINNKAVQVINISNSSQIRQPDILFIGQTEQETLEQILQKTKGKPILTISDKKGNAEKGVMINFSIKNNKVAFEVNESAARESHLIINYRLLSAATTIHPTNKPAP